MKIPPCHPSKGSSCRPRVDSRGQGGAALIIILAFIVLLLVLLLAFFSRATLQEQISKSSSSYTVVDVFAEGATESIIGDLRQEIAAGSLATNIVTAGVTNTIYYPLTNTTFEPAVSGFKMTNGLESLLKVSGITNFAPTNISLYSGLSTNPITNRASSDSTANVSLNGRSISTTRWNQPLFIARANPSDTNTSDTTPTNTFPVPTWVLVARDGSNPTNTTVSTNMMWSTTNSSTVIGRYAYAVYDEGYSLDANVAGYPNDGTQTTGVYASNSAYKSAEAFADLTQIGLTTNQIAAIVGWRNSASVPVSGGTYPNYSFPANDTNYVQMVMGNTNGFMSVATNVTSGGLTDRMFSSRQQLITFLENADPNGYTNALNSLRYLSTHTRDLNQPSFVPATNRPVVLNTNLGGNSAFSNNPQDNIINPSFLSVRVNNSFIRNDGTTANVGEPLVKQRFALNRIAWLTYKGPSGNLSKLDPEMMALQSNGISYSFLTNGTAANIKKYFGLQWNTGYWSYNVNNGNGSGVGAINTLPGIAAAGTPHDPDFFELLKASIAVGSLGKAAVNSSTAVLPSQPIANGFNIYTPLTYVTSQVPANYRYKIDTSVDYHIMQIGANIINQFHIDSFPRRIVIKDSSNPNGIEFDGVTDLPYLNYIYNGFLRTSISQGSIVQVPVVFNPYDPNGTRSPTALYPQKFQALIDCNDPKSLANNGGDLSYSTWSSGVDATNGIHFSYSSGALGVGQKDVIQFWPGTGNNVAFREPTWLIRATNSAGANGVNVLRLSGNITCIDTNVISGANDKAGASYSPLVLGTVPLTFTFTNASTKPPSTTNITATTAYIGPLSNTNEHRVYFTYRLQYLDPVSGNYITYDTKYGRVSSGIFYFNNGGTYSPSIGCWSDNAKNWTWGASIDPRSARFGIFTGGTGGILAQNEFATAPSVPCLGLSLVAWIDITNGISLPLRPDQAAGHYLWDPDTNDPLLTIGSDITQQKYLAADIPMTDVPFPKNSAGWGQIKTIMEGPQYVPGFSLGIYAQNNVSAPFYSGRFVPEPTSGNYTTNQPSFYADADGVVRRGTFAYMGVGSLTNSTGNIFPCSASNPVGQPEAACIYSPPYQEPYTNPANVANFPNIGVGYPPPVSTNQIVPYTTSPFSQSQSRPLFLHRPFRSVAELGYVFRDLPWKNIDFSTPESGDTALLDVFCINPTSDPNNLVAGRVDLNTRQTNVLMAIVNGAYVDDPKVTNLTVGTLSTNLASNIATALLNFTSTNTTISTNTGPLMNLANLVGRYVSNSPIVSVTTISSTGAPLWTNSKSSFLDGKSSYIGFSGIFTNNYSTTNAADLVTAYNQSLSTNHQYLTSMINIQRFHEAPIRALSSAGQTRVWNLMIDLIAQTGRYPSSANTLNNFSVEGEQRYWVHLSIDRLTGAVIDKQIEVVRE